MASSSYKSTEETTNANRACRLLLGPCTDQLRYVFRYYVPPATFPQVIVQQSPNLPRMTVAQRDLILPRGRTYVGIYDDMDIPLLYILLRNICNIVHITMVGVLIQTTGIHLCLLTSRGSASLGIGVYTPPVPPFPKLNSTPFGPISDHQLWT